MKGTSTRPCPEHSQNSIFLATWKSAYNNFFLKKISEGLEKYDFIKILTPLWKKNFIGAGGRCGCPIDENSY